MELIGGLRPTGRRLRGPASDLVELDSDNGLKHTAIVFHPEHRGHAGINDALVVVRGFLESPWVTGLVELVGHDAEQGAFVYPTGQVWSVAEAIRLLADAGEQAGVRAGLISLEDACERYKLSVEEFLSWQKLIEDYGMRGLRATRIQKYRNRREPSEI